LYRTDVIGVLNTRLNLSFRVRATWPAAWATGPAYTFSSLAAVSTDTRSVVLMTPRGGNARTLVPAGVLHVLAGGATAPIVSLAWSAEGDRLAIAVDDGPGPGRDGLAVVDPRTGRGLFISWPRAPASLSWAPGDRLIAEFRDGPLDVRTVEIVRDRVAARLMGLREASWSHDGRWILARQLTRWVQIDANDPSRRIGFPSSSSRWYRAGWCCPPVPVIRLGE
jgi:hypothetical protein